MATAKALPTVSGPEPSQVATGVIEDGGEGALVPVSPGNREERESFLNLGGLILGRAAQIPVEVDVAVPVREFRVRNLLALEPGQVIETRWANGEDVPLASGQVRLAWSEFEVQESELAVRITRLA